MTRHRIPPEQFAKIEAEALEQAVDAYRDWLSAKRVRMVESEESIVSFAAPLPPNYSELAVRYQRTFLDYLYLRDWDLRTTRHK